MPRPIARALALGFWALCLGGPLHGLEAVGPVGAVEVYFTPGDDATGAICAAIGLSKTRILVQAYSFTSVPIGKALVAAKERDIDVQVIVDKSQEGERFGVSDFLAGKGIPVMVDDKPAIAHNKVMILDDAVVITGSFNFTKAGQERNAENLLILHSPDLAGAYTRNWQARFALSRPFVRRFDR